MTEGATRTNCTASHTTGRVIGLWADVAGTARLWQRVRLVRSQALCGGHGVAVRSDGLLGTTGQSAGHTALLRRLLLRRLLLLLPVVAAV